MQRGERDLGRADEVQVVLGQVVDLLLGVGQHARAVERLLAHEHRRDDRLEAVAAQLLERPAHERELEEHEVAAQVGEARARQPRAALHVDALAGELEVVAAGLRRRRRPRGATVSSCGASGSGRFGSATSRRVALALERVALGARAP